MGSGYIIEHCVSALDLEREQKLYRTFTAEVLYNINDILASAFNGMKMTKRYPDLLNPPQEDDRTEGEIINHIQQKLKGLG